MNRAISLVVVMLAPLLMGANMGTLGGGPGNVAIYGDSMSNDGNPSACEWCDPLVAEGFTIWGMAQGGARTYDNDVADPNQCASGGTPAYEGCEFFGERQVAYLDGACRRDYGAPIYTGDTAELSCIADLPLSSQTVDVFFFGANDIGARTNMQWLATYRALSLAAWEVMLDASDAAGHGNVIVLGPPYLKADVGFTDSDGSLVDLHAALRTECASRPRCVIADVYSAFRAVETIHGSAALFEMYSDDCPDTACIHPLDGPTATAGVMPRQMMGNIIMQAIYVANTARIADVPTSSFPLTLILCLVLGHFMIVTLHGKVDSS